ncbi:MAG: M56 family metallopeptidase [Lachnospiraceae bacterium]|nr:M56 family metallopeptidase [Lachnospiraceae bacterium]
MEELAIHIFNLSISAGVITLMVILLRTILRRAPKGIRLIMWGLVAVRLVLPLKIESPFGLMPKSICIPTEILNDQHSLKFMGTEETALDSISAEELNMELFGAEESGTADEQTSSEVTDKNPRESADSESDGTGLGSLYSGELHLSDPMWSVHKLFKTLAVVWIIGMAGMLVYMLLSYIWIKYKVRICIPLEHEKGVFESDGAETPFILGLFRPVIYLSPGLTSEEQDMVLAHERAHIRHWDHIWKLLGFVLLSVYWFQPLLWTAYLLFCRDIEYACDERVIRGMEPEAVKQYSRTLLVCGAESRRIAACPLAFGEKQVRGRIKAILNYKKPPLWIVIIAIFACIGIAVTMLASPDSTVEPETISASQLGELEVLPAVIPNNSDTIMLNDYDISLDYADDTHVIFHSRDGLYICNYETPYLMRSVDFASIGCDEEKGNAVSDIEVYKDGHQVMMSIGNHMDYYIYDVKKNRLDKISANVAGSFERTDEPIPVSDYLNDDALKTICGEFGFLTFNEDQELTLVVLDSKTGAMKDLAVKLYRIAENDAHAAPAAYEYSYLFHEPLTRNYTPASVTEHTPESVVKAVTDYIDSVYDPDLYSFYRITSLRPESIGNETEGDVLSNNYGEDWNGAEIEYVMQYECRPLNPDMELSEGEKLTEEGWVIPEQGAYHFYFKEQDDELSYTSIMVHSQSYHIQ